MSTPDGLFDTLVNRADKALKVARPSDPPAFLLEWHARVRFARRITLEQLRKCLELRPDGDLEIHWEGGEGGSWLKGKAKFP